MARRLRGAREDRAGGAGKATVQNWIQKFPAFWVWGCRCGSDRGKESQRASQGKVSPFLRFQVPEQAASTEAVSEGRKQVSIKEKGYESTKQLNQMDLARSTLAHVPLAKAMCRSYKHTYLF